MTTAGGEALLLANGAVFVTAGNDNVTVRVIGG
jgi:hypothetical protein